MRNVMKREKIELEGMGVAVLDKANVELRCQPGVNNINDKKRSPWSQLEGPKPIPKSVDSSQSAETLDTIESKFKLESLEYFWLTWLGLKLIDKFCSSNNFFKPFFPDSHTFNEYN